MTTGGSDRAGGSVDSGDLRELAAWLRDEDDLRGRVSLSAQPIRDGEMGGVSDAVTVAIGNGGLAVVLIRSLFTWLRTRRRKGTSRTVLKLRSESGRQAELDIAGAANADTVVDKVLEFMRGSESGVWIDIRTGGDPTSS